MFQRKAIEDLRLWAASEHRKPLVLRGARQVGKSTLVYEFGQEFDVFIPLNLERREHVRLFDYDIDDTVRQIFLLTHHPLDKTKKTLLFIDEIQNSPNAVALLRYFYESYPWIDVIAAGSLLLTLLDQHISFPVGRVQYMRLNPCSFADFLQATDNALLCEEVETLAISPSLHEMTMRLFSEFALVGGMPEAIARYAENHDIVAVHDVYDTLLRGYSEDVEKYAKNDTMKNVIRLLLKNGWTYSTEQITLGNFAESNYKSREMGEAIRTLERTYLLELTYPITTYVLPAIQEHRRKPKIFWLDAGLINYAANIQQEVMFSDNIMDIWRGKLAEQMVAQELLSGKTEADAHRDFWVRNTPSATAELDFVYIYKGEVIPVEVKAGHNAHLKSLQIFMENTDHHTAIRIWAQPLQVDEVATPSGKPFRLLSVPFYYVHILDKVLERFG